MNRKIQNYLFKQYGHSLAKPYSKIDDILSFDKHMTMDAMNRMLSRVINKSDMYLTYDEPHWDMIEEIMDGVLELKICLNHYQHLISLEDQHGQTAYPLLDDGDY